MAPRKAWKTGEQLEFLLSEWEAFKRAQDEKKLDRFWQRIFDLWYTRWPLPLSSTLPQPEAARLMARGKKNAQIKTWFNNRGRTDSSKSGRGDLKLDANEKRKLAPVQAYCTYAWDSVLRPIVLARWAQEKGSEMFDDDEDPPEGEDTSSAESCIPLAFKIKIARELYEGLTDGEKDEIDRRREEDRKKMYLKVTELEEEDRIARLRVHKKNQPFAGRSMLRVLGNLEIQAGCFAQLFVASVNPESGNLKIQKFCQGRTEQGIDFETFYGEGWADNVEKKFGEWAIRGFGDVDSQRRGVFTLQPRPDASSQAEASGASTSGTSTSETSPSTQSNSPQDLPAPATSSGKSKSRPRATKKAKSRPVDPLKTFGESTSQPPMPHSSLSSGTSTTQATGVSEPTQSVSALAAIPPTPCATSNPPPSVDALGTDKINDMTLFATAVGVHQLLVQAAATSESHDIVEPVPPVANPSQPVINPSQLVVSPSQLFVNPSQVVVEPNQSPPEAVVAQPGPGVTPIPPLPTTSATDVVVANSTPKVQYRVRSSANTVSGVSSRRGSIDGVPEMGIYLPTNPEKTSHQDSIENDESEVVVDLRDYISDGELESLVSSSQKTSDEIQDLLPPPPPPSSQRQQSDFGGIANQPQSTNTRTYPQLNIDEEDLPTWMVKKSQWKYIASTAGGPTWEELLNVYMRQERRLEFADTGATLPHEERPSKVKEYFQYAHQPSRGDTLTVPGFGAEVVEWWKRIQPEWRRTEQVPPQGPSAWSYILSGGSKGVFLIIMCLAWWDRAHARYLEEVKNARRIEAEAVGRTANFDDLPDHDAEWLDIVNDVAFVMDKAQNCDVPTRGMPSPGRRTKRKLETEPSTPRKKPAVRSSLSRTRSKA